MGTAWAGNVVTASSIFPKLNVNLDLQITFSNNALLVEFLVGSSFLDLPTRKSALGMPEKWTVIGEQEVEVFQMPVGRFFAPTYKLALVIPSERRSDSPI